MGGNVIKNYKQSTMLLFFLWLLVVPPGIFYLAMNYFPENVNWLMVIVFGLVGFLIVYFPIKRNGSPIFTVMWITVPAFLLHGLLIEVLVMQIAILGIFRSPQPRDKKIYFLFFDSFWFFIVSIVSATVFHWAGGEIGSTEFWSLLVAVFCYQLVHTSFVRLLIRLFSYFIDLKTAIFTQDIFINYGKIIVLVPLSLSLYYLYQHIGYIALILLGIPYFFFILIIRMNNVTERVNHNLQQAGRIGHELSGKRTVDEVIDQFVLKITELFEPEYTYLFNCENDRLELIRYCENSRFAEVDFPYLQPGEGITGHVLLNRKPVIYTERAQWKEIALGFSHSDTESVLCVPIMQNGQMEAVLLLASNRKNYFKGYQLKILDFLGSYFTVSVENARYLENIVVESNRCMLTNLYNYRFLEEHLAFTMERVNDGYLDKLSIIMLDIDHFKKVNDTYGHQSGNDILCMLAEKLKTKLPAGGVVARYGGEEFVYLLSGIGKEEALVFAEDLRAEIEQSEFLVTPDLGADKSTAAVHITVSVGVSTAPDDAEDGQSLLRNADRILYLWAKQAGRNRVAGYVR